MSTKNCYKNTLATQDFSRTQQETSNSFFDHSPIVCNVSGTVWNAFQIDCLITSLCDSELKKKQNRFDL